jgi:hypothetical protein
MDKIILKNNNDRNPNGTFRKGGSFVMSEETKRKIGNAQLGEKNHAYGKTPWNKGKTGYLSEDSKKKMSIAKLGKSPWSKGKKFSKEHVEKLSKSHLGFKRPEVDKIKISKSMKGKQNSLGVTQSKDTILLRVKSLPKGSSHHWWKGGKTVGTIKERGSLEMKLWKKACMERDNFTCQKTGVRGGKLEVHHINNFADFSELRTSIENGITLSKESHKEFHKIYGMKNNTREQLEEFLGRKI